MVAVAGLVILGAPAFLIVAGALGTGMLASVAGGSIGLGQRIKTKVLEDVLLRLDETGDRLCAQIQAETATHLDNWRRI